MKPGGRTYKHWSTAEAIVISREVALERMPPLSRFLHASMVETEAVWASSLQLLNEKDLRSLRHSAAAGNVSACTNFMKQIRPSELMLSILHSHPQPPVVARALKKYPRPSKTFEEICASLKTSS
jgi:hypothetical protein